MFEDFDNEDDDFELTEVEKWYDDFYRYFYRPSRESLDLDYFVPLDINLFYESIYKPIKQEIEIRIRRLAYKQFPIIKSDNRKAILKYIDDAIEEIGINLLLSLWGLIQDHKEGVDLRKKYPDFEKWVSFYARPEEPPEIDYSFADNNPELKKHISEEIIKKVAEESHIEELEAYFYLENRKKEFYDSIQPLILKYYKELDDFDYEAWVIYAMLVREEYETYIMYFEQVEATVEYGLDEEDINLTGSEYLEKLCIKMREKRENEEENTTI